MGEKGELRGEPHSCRTGKKETPVLPHHTSPQRGRKADAEGCGHPSTLSLALFPVIEIDLNSPTISMKANKKRSHSVH